MGCRRICIVDIGIRKCCMECEKREECNILCDDLDQKVEEMKNKEQTNACCGCFGAANGDCDECPVMNGDSGKDDVNVQK